MLLLLLCLACAPQDLADSGERSTPGAGGAPGADGGAEGDGGADEDTGGDVCADAATVTWASWGHGFLIEACQGCHASTAANRNGAPDDVVFDTVEDAWTHADRILARAAAEPPSMPPMGGTTEDDRTRLRWWLQCGEPGS